MKKILREEFKKKRSFISAARRAEATARALQEFSSLKSVLSFMSIRDEIDLWPLNHHLAENKELILPRVEGHALVLYRVSHIDEDLASSDWGIFEPIPEKCEKSSPQEILYALVPGLAFDAAKHRVGYGKGHYDRLLPQLTRATKIGVGFKEQLLNEPIPFEPGDHPLDGLFLF